MSSSRRVGWIDQLCIEKVDWSVAQFERADIVDRWFDRFCCRHRQEPSGGFVRIRYGPAVLDLADAIAWCERHCDHAFIDVFGERWSTGGPREGFAPLPPIAERLAREAEQWSVAADQEWAVEVSLNLGLRDYEDAAPIFERSLRSLATVDRCSLDWVHDSPHTYAYAHPSSSSLASSRATSRAKRRATSQMACATRPATCSAPP